MIDRLDIIGTFLLRLWLMLIRLPLLHTSNILLSLAIDSLLESVRIVLEVQPVIVHLLGEQAAPTNWVCPTDKAILADDALAGLLRRILDQIVDVASAFKQ